MVGTFPVLLDIQEVGVQEVRDLLAKGFASSVGHADTAAVFSTLLGRAIEPARTTILLGKGDVLVVGQYKGPRLPEGATSLPAGATIQWLLVTLK